jgi:autoinducer 2-degrading protein
MMYIVHVSIKVKEEHISVFREATIENAQNSVNEAGIARFDVLQQQDDPSRFLLVEVYYTPEDQLKHRETEHFKKWRATITDMIAEPYTFIKYYNAFPDESGWASVNK